MIASERSVALAIALTLAGVGPSVGADLKDTAAAIVERTNAFRESKGLATQSSDADLQAAAREFARFMARRAKFGHGADGRTPAERAQAAGYDYCLVLENIAYRYRPEGYDTAALARRFVEGWKESAEHRENMLDPDATQTGVGLAQGEDGRYFAVQLFGRPRSAAIRFKVVNAAGATLEYDAGDRSYALPPRAARTHTVCRPLELMIPLPAQQGAFTDRPGNGATYEVVERAGERTVLVDG